MTGRRSNCRSAALAIVAGCYAEPDLEITVMRHDTGFNVHIDACHLTGDCEGNFAFPSSEGTERDVFVFVDQAVPDIRLQLDRDSPSCWRGCVTLKLASEVLRRTLTLGQQPEPVWTGGTGETFAQPGDADCPLVPCP